MQSYLDLWVDSVTPSIGRLLDVLGLNNMYLETIVSWFHVNL